ncbi:hypothetical protein IE53DRAFT_74797 [Violaceomyces palustris]|uniref:Uncharacterized protein n=1 Tax=Violaceomyces palustris TaxID=1673888 RepID=A0ACD0NYP4_9BASI|nr:hypothetical protein IE53DRAFT_74797 [Violaceomyces palustris]
MRQGSLICLLLLNHHLSFPFPATLTLGRNEHHTTGSSPKANLALAPKMRTGRLLKLIRVLALSIFGIKRMEVLGGGGGGVSLGCPELILSDQSRDASLVTLRRLHVIQRFDIPQLLTRN